LLLRIFFFASAQVKLYATDRTAPEVPE